LLHFFFIYFILYFCSIYLSITAQFYLAVTAKGLTTPCLHWVAKICYLCVIRLQRIYNFLLFHTIIVSILYVLYAIICHYISFFETNLLIQCQVPVAVFLIFFCLFRKSLSNESRRINFGLIFSRPKETLEASGEDQTSHEGATSPEGAPPKLVGPSWHLLT
jgi:hypothetical protein